MDINLKRALTRRSLLRAGLISGGVLLTGFDALVRASPALKQEKGAFAGGKLLGLVEFADERPVQMDTAFGAELDGRLYTDLSTLSGTEPVTPAA